MNGRPGMNSSHEKAKDFKNTIKRLIKELKGYRLLIVFSLILAVLGSILSIIAPNKLSSLTNEIQGALQINSNNLQILNEHIENETSEEVMYKKLEDIINLEINNDTINKINNNNTISESEKEAFNNFVQKNKPITELNNLSNDVLNIILNESLYKETEISIEDKITLIKNIMDITKYPNNIKETLLEEITIDEITISSKDQINYINMMQNTNNSNELMTKLTTMPDNISKVLSNKINWDQIKMMTINLLGLYIFSATFTYLESISMTDVANKFARRLRQNISIKINKLPLKYFDKHRIGDTLSRVTNDIDMIAQSMNNSLATLVSALTLFIGTIIMMFITNYLMAITAIIASFIGFILMFIVLMKSQKYFIQRQIEIGNLNAHIEEIYSGINVVKAYNGQKDANNKFDQLNQKVYNCNKKGQFLSGIMMPIMHFVGNLGYVAVCIVGALLTSNGSITFGVIVAFIVYVRLFTSPLSQIAQAMTSIQSTAAASERVFEFLDEKEMDDESHIVKKLSKEEVKGNIEFKNITFKYDGNDKPTIYNFSAEAKPGQKIAIVGPTGAGKTTMVNLLMKFYDITEGDILIDGVSTKEITRENVHDLFTMVLQDTWIFNGTIKENIIFNNKNIKQEEIEKVCKKVGIHHLIKTMSKGYDTVINDDDSVSAGEKQLITIARGMIDNAPFLILDEATSNVDTRTEELVQEAMDKLTQNKTSFIIAHRLSTIKNADLILVMKDGNIIEQGTHNELLKQKGFYYELYNAQFEN